MADNKDQELERCCLFCPQDSLLHSDPNDAVPYIDGGDLLRSEGFRLYHETNRDTIATDASNGQTAQSDDTPETLTVQTPSHSHARDSVMVQGRDSDCLDGHKLDASGTSDPNDPTTFIDGGEEMRSQFTVCMYGYRTDTREPSGQRAQSDDTPETLTVQTSSHSHVRDSVMVQGRDSDCLDGRKQDSTGTSDPNDPTTSIDGGEELRHQLTPGHGIHGCMTDTQEPSGQTAQSDDTPETSTVQTPSQSHARDSVTVKGRDSDCLDGHKQDSTGTSDPNDPTTSIDGGEELRHQHTPEHGIDGYRIDTRGPSGQTAQPDESSPHRPDESSPHRSEAVQSNKRCNVLVRLGRSFWRIVRCRSGRAQ